MSNNRSKPTICGTDFSEPARAAADAAFALATRLIHEATDLSTPLWSNLWIYAGIAAMLIAQILFTHAPVMNRLFHTAPLDLASWIYITSVGLAAYCIVEFEKWVRRKVRHSHSQIHHLPSTIPNPILKS